MSQRDYEALRPHALLASTVHHHHYCMLDLALGLVTRCRRSTTNTRYMVPYDKHLSPSNIDNVLACHLVGKAWESRPIFIGKLQTPGSVLTFLYLAFPFCFCTVLGGWQCLLYFFFFDSSLVCAHSQFKGTGKDHVAAFAGI